MTFHIGVTGTHLGMNELQKVNLTIILTRVFIWHKELAPDDVCFHHGDCIGVDVEAAEIAKQLGYWVVCHPPINEYRRAFHASDVILPQYGYHERNKHIVDASETMLVVPYQLTWQPRGGTWHAHDYAVQKKKRIVMLYREENENPFE